MPFVGEHCKNLTSLECEFDLDKLKCIKITVNFVNSDDDKVVNLYGIIDSLPEEINEIHILFNRRYNRIQKIFWTFKKFKNLKKLTVNGLWSENILQEIAEITTLVHLNIRLYRIPKEFFLFNKLVNLEYIELTMPLEYKAKNFSTKVLETIFCTCKNLKHLYIPRGSYDVADIPIKEWINFQNLEYLGISCEIMPDLANTIVKYCKNLKDLRIHYPDYLMNETALEKLTELENLESLILLLGVRLSEESIISISNNCKKLKRLEIPHSTLVPYIDGEPLSSPSVLDELSNLQYLEHLNLRYAKNLKDSTIIAIAYNCKNLKSLNIVGCRTITDTALVALSNLKNLKKLNVNYLDRITDIFLEELKGLKELHCNECKEITDVGIIKFIKNNPDLEKISVKLIYNITDKMVIAADKVQDSSFVVSEHLRDDCSFGEETIVRALVRTSSN
ncbi:F-box/LRR-repeat protein fbxl-1-like [Aphidius gifuensis]|uniref:F-box/LRR-repeat protein fbxl-1-like n=1 Tax=Aphidius gifuensis TaxID=684658 RepID=UPI001CDB9A03|nr:F-box/LRR-repeat protein fbxl-1-like [Aphidius gifuensis]